MRKLLSISEFENENSNLILGKNQTNKISAGIAIALLEETNDWCQTLNDTCVDFCTDIHHVKSIDGVVTYDKTSFDGTDCP